MDFMVDRLGDGRVYPAMLVSAGKLELSYGFLAIFFDRSDCGSLLLGRFQGADMRPKEPRDSGHRDPLRARLDQIIDT